jgi:hypothetical protein
MHLVLSGESVLHSSRPAVSCVMTCLGLALAAVACSSCGNSEETSQANGTRPPTTASHAGQDNQPGSLKTLARFQDVTRDSGIEFVYRNGEEAGRYSIVESLGGGVGLIDFDLDGRLDLFAPGGGRFGSEREMFGLPSALFRHVGGGYSEVAEKALVHAGKYYSHGAAIADADNDGFPDILMTGYGGLMFFHNEGDGTFREQALAAGLTDSLWSSSAGWGDIDGDGALDLYVAHYANWSFDNDPFCEGPRPNLREVCPPRSFEPLPDFLYLSNADGTFRDASAEAGLRKDGKGLGVVIADVDLDRRLDIYVGNDTVPNFLYLNAGGGKLSDTSLISGASLGASGTPDGSMGVDVGDFNLDGLPDLWVANFERESNALYRNEGKGFFQHISQSTGVTAVGALYVGWGTMFLDYDRDADEDLFVSNGHVIRYPVNAPLRQTPLLLENLAGKRVENIAPAAGRFFTEPHMGRGAACGDIDNDGDLDLAVSHTNEPLVLLSNESPNTNHWISIRLIGTKSSRAPIGATVRVHAGGKVQLRQLKGGVSYGSTQDPRLFVGLGDAKTVERIEIQWPAGGDQAIEGPAVDQFLTVVEP